jgi:hydroxypyruvate reductase/glycerate 2-kinase
MQATYQLLLHSGASIDEMNTVRKHLSLIKGGQLAQYAHHVRLQTFLLSDVPMNTAHMIGSGPTLTDPTTFQDAIDVLHSYQLVEKVPSSVQDYLRKGAFGFHPDTPKPGLNDHPDQQIHLITGAETIGPFLESLISQQGFSVHWSNTPIQESIKKEAQRIAAEVISVLNGQTGVPKNSPQALLFQGESYSMVQGSGKGGRNQELALLLALSLEGQHPVSILTFATDGIDGPTDAAGALVTSYSTLDARKQECSPESYIQDNDSYHFHEQMNTLVKTGLTGNNLMDLCVVLIG